MDDSYASTEEDRAAIAKMLLDKTEHVGDTAAMPKSGIEISEARSISSPR
jgi:hypothetical protein